MRGKHAGDTGTFDEKGNINPRKLEDMFTKHDADHDSALSESEIRSMVATNKRGSHLGAFLSKVEFGLLLSVAGELRGESQVLTRQTLQRFYDGSLLYALAGQPIPN